jgi:hypothetical protein
MLLFSMATANAIVGFSKAFRPSPHSSI